MIGGENEMQGGVKNFALFLTDHKKFGGGTTLYISAILC